MASPSMIGVIDTYGIELIHPRRERRSCGQIGKKEYLTNDGLSVANCVC